MPAAGGFRFTSLHFRATLRFATFRSIQFIVSPSLGNPRKSASIHSIALMPSPFLSAPLWLPSPQAVILSQNGKLHSTQPNSLYCIQSPPLLFPMPTSGMSCEVFTPENQRPQNSPPPFNGAGKNKGAFAQGHVLAAGSSHSFNRSL
jgi:hypothetical protein